MSKQQELEVLVTERQLADHWKMKPASLRNARYRGEGPSWIKTPTGSIRYRLADVITWDRARQGFTFEGFARLVARMSFIDDRQKKLLLQAVNAEYRPQNVATTEGLQS